MVLIISLVAQGGGGGSAALLISLLLMVGIFYFLLIRPQQRRARAQRDLVESLGVGDEIVTVGGMYGTIRALDEDSVTIEISPGTDVRFVKSAILRKQVAEEEEEEEEEGEEAGETS
jgi:preprotein translocase subunit YajC